MLSSRIKRFTVTLLLAFMCLSFFRVNSEAKAIFTGNSGIDCAAEAIISRASKEGMSKKEKLKACYTYIVKNMHYSHRNGRVRIKPTKAEKKAYKMKLKFLKASKKITYSRKFKGDWRNLLTMKGTCKDMSGVMCILANHLGYKAGYKTGRFVRNNGSSVEHWWNWIRVGGKKLYCDVQAANFGRYSKRRANSYYLKSNGNRHWRRHHRG